MNKKDFIEIMTELKLISDASSKIDKAMKELSPDFGGFLNDRAESLVVKLLKKAMNDESEHSEIDYFIYEIEWGTKFYEGCEHKDGTSIPLATVEDLWDRLIETKRRNSENYY